MGSTSIRTLYCLMDSTLAFGTEYSQRSATHSQADADRICDAHALFQNATKNVAKIIGMLQIGCGGYIDTAQIHVHQPIWETFCRNMEDPKFPDSVYQFGGIFYFGELHWNRVCR